MSLAKTLFKTGLLAGATFGALAVVNKLTEAMAGELDTVLNGEERRYPWKYGGIFYQLQGAKNAPPLVLIHSLSPGASSSEWRKNVDALAEQFCVYALDLLGFGLSDHPAIDYDGELYADLIADFLKDAVGQPAIVVGHGLSCAYAIAAAYRFPALFEQLVLVSPHEIILQDIELGSLNAFCKLLLRAPIIGQSLCNLLTTRQNIRDYHLRQGYQNPNLVTDEFVEYLYTSAHQPKSHLALASLLSGYLHLNVQEPLAHLKMLITVIWGHESQPNPSLFQRLNQELAAHIIEQSNLQVQDEQADPFNKLIRELARSTTQ